MLRIALCFALLLFPAFAADGGPGASPQVQVLQAEVNHRKEILEERIRNHEQVTKERMEAQDKRIGDLANHSSWFANWGIGLLGLIFVVLAFAAYVNAGAKIKEVAEEWIEKHLKDLHARIQEAERVTKTFEDRVQEAEKIAEVCRQNSQNLQHQQDQLKRELEAFRQQLSALMTEAEEVVNNRLDDLTQKIRQGEARALSAAELKTVNHAKEQASNKPENQRLVSDWQALALEAHYSGRFEDALSAFAQIALHPEATSSQKAQALINKGFTLGQLNRSEEGLEAYTQVIHDYALDPSPALREEVARALANKGFVLRKLNRSEEALEAYTQVIRDYALDLSPSLRKQVAQALNSRGFGRLMDCKRERLMNPQWLHIALEDFIQADLSVLAPNDQGMVLGNRAYAHFLLGETDQAEPILRQALALGGEAIYQAEKDDAAMHPLPQDAEFLALLERVWRQVEGEGPASS